jgi:hypothetical protein
MFKRLRPSSKIGLYKTRLGLAAFLLVCSLLLILPTAFLSGGAVQGQKGDPAPVKIPETHSKLVPFSAQAVAFVETQTLGSLEAVPLTPEEMEKFRISQEDKEKNETNVIRVKQSGLSKTGTFIDRSINNFKAKDTGSNIVTNPIQSFDGPDADLLPALFGGRFAPPDTNAAVGPNHVVITTNSMVQVFNKSGVALTPAVRISTLMAGITNAGDDDGDPIVVYDSLADRWLVSQFNLRFVNNSMHEHIAISKTGDPTGAYFAYDFPLSPGRFGDYPHFGVWPDGYYMSTNDFNSAGTAFLGAGFYAFERTKMLAGNPTAKIIGFNTPTPSDGGILPANLQGFTPPPVGTPNVFGEWFDTPPVFRGFEFRPNYINPIASTLTQLADIPIGAFDARSPASRAVIDQPAPGEGLDNIADRIMHAMNFRMLPGGVQSFVLNWTVNVSGVNPTNAATYQGGVRWLELRRNAGTGIFSVSQEATYAPGSGSGTGRNLWMASIAQDGEGNIGLAANATAPGPTPAPLNPTVIYTGRLAGDPANTLPQGEVDALSAVTKGVQTATSNRWGDYSSLFVDPADECTFWGAFEYVDSPTATFDWNTRIISFKVNPTCVTAPRGAFSGVITNCATGQPILDAVVETTDGFLRTTDASGNYSVSASPGTYTVKVSKPGSGFNTVMGNVTVTNGGNAIFNACLQPTAIIVSAGATIVSENCAPANGAIDPGETVTVSFCVQNTGGLDTTSLVGTLQSTGGVTSPSGPQNYGVVVAGGPPVCRNFTFTAAGACGSTITATIQLQDGATNLGTLTYTFTLGTLRVAFTQNFDGVTVPNLPAGWTATQGVNAAAAPLWVSSNSGTPAPPADTAPNAIFTPDPNNLLDNRIDTPPIAITTATAQLTFRNNFNLEDTFDGGVVEISNPAVNAGAFQDIITAGGSFVVGTQAYTDTISVNFANPIAGRQAFSGTSGGFVTTSINLPANSAGQNIVIRFRMGSDNSVAAVGWRVDTITITDGFQCCTNSIVPCAENFDSVTAPALPPNWTATTAIDCANSNPWATVSTTSDTPPNSAFVNDPNCIADERLDSRIFPIVSASAVLTFRRNNNLESGFDGMVLEISIGGGPFQDILAAGGTFGTGGYNGTISVNFGSPIGGRQAWTGNSGGFVTTTVNLPASANGQNIVLRWRRGSDSSVSGVGAFIDTISITGSNCGGQPCVVTCPANITRSNDPNQCGAVVTYPAPTTTGTCGTVTCSPASGSFFPKGTTTVTCTPATGPACTFTVTVNDTQPPTITCPANITQSNDPNQCGAVVNYPAPTVSDNCPGVGAPMCSPASGSFFPKGTTTVTCTVADSSGNTATCTFTITVNDTQPPSITCPANVTAVTNQVVCPSPTCTTVTFPNPVATDNCPGVTVACVPPSGGCFNVGVTTVTCTATDTSGNTATCSFTVTTFDVALQDDSVPGTILLWNSLTGQYRFCCGGTTFTGVGKVQTQGCVYTLSATPADRRVQARVDKAAHAGSASLQSPPGTTRCTITDRDTRNDTNLTQCQ